MFLIRLLIFGLLLIGRPSFVEAACSGSSPTLTAANATRTEVLACVSAASDGDTIIVPSGTASWTSPIDLPAIDLTVMGHGGTDAVTCTGTAGESDYVCTAEANPTAITCNAGCFSIDFGATHRITGFTMTSNFTGYIIQGDTGTPNTTDYFRIDHNRLISTSAWQPNRMSNMSGSGTHIQGIWDHNILEDGVSIHPSGTLCQLDEACGGVQHAIWAETTTLGNSTSIVYIEANYFVTSVVDTVNSGDGNYGMRVVIRFNRVNGSHRTAWEFHSPQGENRGTQRWELYHNTAHNLDVSDNCFQGLASIRGGTGVAFNNTVTGDFDNCNFDILIDNVRSEGIDSEYGAAESCDGGSAWDENTTGEQGWHCRDQLGIAKDNTLWDDSPAGAWDQLVAPAYFWGNVKPGPAILVADIDPDERNPTHIVANRDIYDEDATFDGTTGVGIGTIGSRPSTCTAGVGYWATDEGEWNSTNGATADGRLYKCTATNTWTLYYTPYDYPHPWTGAEGGGEEEGSSAPIRVRIAGLLGGLWLGRCLWTRGRRRRTRLFAQ